MTLSINRSVVVTVVSLACFSTQAALQNRDLNLDGTADAFYDSDLDITWLRDANVNGQMDWANALDWASNFSFAGHSNWRLPTSDQCINVCIGSEMGHLYYVELGNPTGGPMTNTGEFQNIQTNLGYYSSTLWNPNPNGVLSWRMNQGIQSPDGKDNLYFAFAVANGDISPIPEPESLALMLVGLGVVYGAARPIRRT